MTGIPDTYSDCVNTSNVAEFVCVSLKSRWQKGDLTRLRICLYVNPLVQNLGTLYNHLFDLDSEGSC